MITVNITQATQADIPLLCNLGKITFTETFAEQNTPEDLAAYLEQSFSKAQLEGELKEEESLFFIAFLQKNNRIFLVHSNTSFIKRLQEDPNN